jgi:hypothetical protein
MLQRYKLRLGDGTILTVDQDALRTWLTDGRATVQVAGTQEWRPLRQFLADEESAARLARALVPPEPRRAPAPAPPEAPPPSAPIERAIGEPPMVQALADETGASGASAPPRRDAAEVAGEAPVIRLKPLDDERPAPDEGWGARGYGVEGAEDDGERPDRPEGPLLQVFSNVGTFLGRCLDPLSRLVRGGSSTPAEGPAPRTGTSVSRGAAPAPVNELPVLRFADTQEKSPEEDLYQGEEADSLLPTLWLWTKRVVLLGGLVTGGVLTFLNWDTWFPRAAEVGQTAFTEIDRQVRARQRAREQDQAVADAAGRLPHLAPATIRLVLSSSDSGVLEPSEVFQLASEAADRGQDALTPAEAAELRTLQRDLRSHLRPPERARVAEYDRARARRVVFPFENPHVLELVARGARAMPAPDRERLQELLGKAVAAGLAPTAGSTGDRSR